jgi:hypothetical protein
VLFAPSSWAFIIIILMGVHADVSLALLTLSTVYSQQFIIYARGSRLGLSTVAGDTEPDTVRPLEPNL